MMNKLENIRNAQEIMKHCLQRKYNELHFL